MDLPAQFLLSNLSYTSWFEVHTNDGPGTAALRLLRLACWQALASWILAGHPPSCCCLLAASMR